MAFIKWLCDRYQVQHYQDPCEEKENSKKTFFHTQRPVILVAHVVTLFLINKTVTSSCSSSCNCSCSCSCPSSCSCSCSCSCSSCSSLLLLVLLVLLLVLVLVLLVLLLVLLLLLLQARRLSHTLGASP